MADEPINLVLSSQVASRFVSSSDLESARLKREEEWKATYERLGQEPPPMPKEEYDGRSLYEKLKETKDRKQEAFEEKLKFKNQFRALDDEEVAFLDDAAQEKRAAEMAKEREIRQEMKRFKEAIASRSTESPTIIPPLAPISAVEVPGEKGAPGSCKTKVASTTTMIPKKSRKAKDFQRSFLAGAIRPKTTHEGFSTAKKRKSSNACETDPTVQRSTDLSNSLTADPKVSSSQLIGPAFSM